MIPGARALQSLPLQRSRPGATAGFSQAAARRMAAIYFQGFIIAVT
jgi:hypothetical protein